MKFLRGAAAGVAAAALLGAAMVLADVAWEGAEPMRRERFFVAALNAVFCGWAAAAIAWLVGRLARRPPPDFVAASFWTAIALAIAPWSGVALGAAALLAFLALRGSLPAPRLPLGAAGALLHLAPAAVYFLHPAATDVLPFRDAPEPLAAAESPGPPVSEQRPDVLLIVADTLRADAILDPATPTPRLDALRARGAWAEYALAPCNQTLPSHMALFTGLDVEQLGMRSNDSRWPAAARLRNEWGMRTLAARLRDAGWRTAGVAANVLLTSAPNEDPKLKPEEREQNFRDGFEWWHGMQRVSPLRDWFRWTVRRTALGLALPDRVLSYTMVHLLNPTTHHNLRTHWREGERTADLALAALAQLHAQPQPGLLFVNFFDPHAPYAAPPPFAGTLAAPERAPAGYAAAPAGEFGMRTAMYDGFRDERRGGPAADFAAEAAYLRLLYQEEVAYLDAQVGRLLDAVEAGGRPTLIVFVGDHGEAFGEHKNVEHRWTLFEEELRVPFIVAGPGVPQGRRLERPPELADATRTILERLGLEAAGVAGRDVLGASDARPPFGMMVYHATVRDGRHKLIASVSYGEHEDPKGEFRPGAYELLPLHLYDLEADPAERTDLLAAPLVPETEAVRDRLVGLMRERMARDEFPNLPPRKTNARQQEQLAQLGYVGDVP